MRKSAALGMALLLAGILSGCAPDSVMPTPPPDPTSTPAFASDEEALAAAEELYGKYIDASNLLGQGGWVEFGLIEEFLRADALDDERETAADFASKGYVLIGSTTFDSLKLQQIENAEFTEMTVYVCLDYSLVDVVDANGASVVDPDRADRLDLEVTMDDFDGDLKIARSEKWSGENFCS